MPATLFGAFDGHLSRFFSTLFFSFFAGIELFAIVLPLSFLAA